MKFSSATVAAAMALLAGPVVEARTSRGLARLVRDDEASAHRNLNGGKGGSGKGSTCGCPSGQYEYIFQTGFETAAGLSTQSPSLTYYEAGFPLGVGNLIGQFIDSDGNFDPDGFVPLELFASLEPSFLAGNVDCFLAPAAKLLEDYYGSPPKTTTQLAEAAAAVKKGLKIPDSISIVPPGSTDPITTTIDKVWVGGDPYTLLNLSTGTTGVPPGIKITATAPGAIYQCCLLDPCALGATLDLPIEL